MDGINNSALGCRLQASRYLPFEWYSLEIINKVLVLAWYVLSGLAVLSDGGDL